MQDDRYRVMAMLEQLGPQQELCCVIVDGDPPSKARARFTKKGRPYTPQKTVEGEKRLAAAFDGIGPMLGNVALACLFYRSSRQRIDIDNLLKAVLDAGTRAKVWEDDSQITALVGLLEHDRERPRSVIGFGRHASSLTRGDDALISCEACGARFFPGGRRRETARWCSAACRAYLADPVDCAHCEQPFKRRSGNQKFCSNECRLAATHRSLRLRTHCAKGHEYTPENTHHTADGRRRCRTCQAANARGYRRDKQLQLPD